MSQRSRPRHDRALDGDELVAFIAARAMTLDEILAARRPGQPKERGGASRLLERWSRTFAAGDRSALQRRLAWDGLDEDSVAAALKTPPAPVIPPYLRILLEVLAESSPPPASCWKAPVPFAHLLAPWVQSARRRFVTLAPHAEELLAPAARQTAERHLLEQLSAVAGAALYRDFDAFRADHAPPPPTSGDHHTDIVYRAFVEELCGPRLADWLADFPVVAKHLCLLSWQWSEGMADLVDHLTADHPALGNEFAAGRRLGVVTAMEGGLSDRHGGGRQVVLLRFEGGVDVVYKPRDVTLEAAWRDLVAWLAAEGLASAPPAPRVVARSGYGWAERMRCEEVRDPADFARRAGALVFLAWLLGGADLHEDNLIATAAGPALVDAEALLQPARADLTTAAATSVLATGLLTFPIITSEGEVADVGGLVGGPRPSPRRRQWAQINSDAMHPAPRPSPPGEACNLPRLEGHPWRPTHLAGNLEEGFAEAYRFCLQRRKELLDPRGPLRRFTSAMPRVVFRPTESYVRMQRALFAPAYQRLGVERSIALDALNRVFALSPHRPRLWPLAAEERAALEHLDVPRFTLTVAAETVTAASGEDIPGVVSRSAWDSLLDRLQELREEDLTDHRRLVRMCAVTQPLADEGATTSATERAAAFVAWREELVAAAQRCAADIDRAVFAGRSAPDLRLWEEVDPRDLYHGLPGIALFYAALHLATGEPGWRARAVASWRAVLSEPGCSGATLGACEGLGGRIYALALLSALLGDEEVDAAARRHLAAFSSEAIVADTRLDVQGGAAGAILGLLAAFQVLNHTRALEVARECALHLLRRQHSDGGWTASDRAAPGFAHGAAGIACALARLADHTGDSRLSEAARRGFLFEYSLYDASRHEWRAPAQNLAGETRHVSMTAWCNGAPGVALALATSVPLEAASLGLDEALAASRRAGFSGLDHLCCGSLGLIDVLLTCGQRLGQESLIRAATARGVVVLRRAHGSEGFAIDSAAHEPGVRLGLFHGLAGAGYLALRLAAPAALPSLLGFLVPRGGAS